MAGLGDILRRAREQQGLTLEEAEIETRIRKKYLIALEAEDFGDLPAPVYIKGFIRNYSNFLSLNADEVLKLYPQDESPATMEIPPQLARPSQGYGVWFSIAAVLGIMLFAGAYFFKQGTAGSPSEPSAFLEIPTVTPASVTTPTPTPQPYADKVEIVARAIEPTWIAVTVDGVGVFTDTLKIGQTETFAGKERIGMRVGNAGGIIITFNGQLKGIMGRPGQVMSQEWTTKGEANPPTPASTPSAPTPISSASASTPRATASPQSSPVSVPQASPQKSPQATPQVSPVASPQVSPQASPSISPTIVR